VATGHETQKSSPATIAFIKKIRSSTLSKSPSFQASLVYRVSARTARATQRNPVSRKKKKKGSSIYSINTSALCRLENRAMCKPLRNAKSFISEI
jgi:hypothetical protein